MAGNLASVVKPLLDGIISQTGWKESQIELQLRNPAADILEPRVVVRAYRQFVKWDPADEHCTEFEVIPDSGGKQCRVWIRPAA